MHAEVFREFERICRQWHRGDAVLEIGAVPAADTLLALPALAGATTRIGISLEGPASGDGYEILQGNAQSMSMFANASFDSVLCNAVLEHDARFWLTLAEMRRVLRPGGLLAIGVPGFAVLGADRALSAIGRLPLGFRRRAGLAAGIGASTLTHRVHDYPADYYRFGVPAVREVFLAGLEETGVIRLLLPPRLLGWGLKPGREK